MFTPEQRSKLRDDLLERAKNDPHISAAAITGSAASNNEDRWSDIDLAFGVKGGIELAIVLAAWTSYMYEHHGTVHHTDVRAGAWIYRVFLLPTTLQVDLAFVPATEFRALSPAFRLVFGRANEPDHWPPPAPEDLIGIAWLYALHARSCIARNQVWQAEYMISGVRDHVLALACLRHDLPTSHGCGFDKLPADLLESLNATLVTSLDAIALQRAFQSVIAALMAEIEIAAPTFAARLRTPLLELASHGRPNELSSIQTSGPSS